MNKIAKNNWISIDLKTGQKKMEFGMKKFVTLFYLAKKAHNTSAPLHYKTSDQMKY